MVEGRGTLSACVWWRGSSIRNRRSTQGATPLECAEQPASRALQLSVASILAVPIHETWSGTD